MDNDCISQFEIVLMLVAAVSAYIGYILGSGIEAISPMSELTKLMFYLIGYLSACLALLILYSIITKICKRKK